jgi:CheY-like chemotaxis protein
MKVLVVSPPGESRVPDLLAALPADIVVTTVDDVATATRAMGDADFDAVLVPPSLFQTPAAQGNDCNFALVSLLRAENEFTALILVVAASDARKLKLRAGLDDVLSATLDPVATLRRAIVRRRALCDRTAHERTVLIVDDDADVGESAAEALRRVGWRVFTATDPFHGLELLAERTPQVVFCDLMMPGLHGTEWIRAALRHTPAIVPIVITGYATIENSIDALRIGAFDFIPKPFTPDQIAAAADRAYSQFLVGRRGRALLSPPATGGRAVIRVLLVEDNEPDEILLRRAIDQVAPGRFQITTAPTLATALVLLGLFAFSLFHAWLYGRLAESWPVGFWPRTWRLGGLVFVLSYAFFEFFTPFNMFWEPLPLVFVELVFWGVIAWAEAFAIVGVLDRSTPSS